MNHKSIDRIKEFWRWFVAEIDMSTNPFEDADFIHSLDQEISDLGQISWELGPGLNDQQNFAFSLSPNGNTELLKLTSLIISMAPTCKGWEFYPARPPKKWRMRFSIEDENEDIIEIDASCWEYVLLKYSSGVFDIIIKMPKITRIPEHLKHSAAVILLDGELGEEKRMMNISNIEIVDEFNNSLINNSNHINVLKEHLSTLISRKD